jgi:hypothetical protein
MMDGEVIGRLPSIAAKKGSDLAYGRETKGDVSMKDGMYRAKMLDEDSSMKDEDSELSEIESDDSEPVHVQKTGSKHIQPLVHGHTPIANAEASHLETPTKTNSTKATEVKKIRIKITPVKKIPIDK